MAGRQKKKPRPSPMGRALSKAEKIHDLLEELHRDLARGNGEGDPVTLSFRPGREASAFARELVDAFRLKVNDTLKTPALVQGRVYCFHCETTSCGHAVPPDHLSVFSSYTPTGFPVWMEFFSAVLEAKDPRIDDLVKEDADIVALCQGKDRLKEEQLQVFGKESPLYDIRGQLVAGYLPLPGRDAQSRCAMTVQAVRTRIKGRPRLMLNIISQTPEGADLTEHLKLDPDPELTGLFKVAQKRLGELKFRDTDESAVLSILRRLGRGIERTRRRSRRRTHHATARRSERPAVGMALKDIESAQPDHLLYDELHHTFIVSGPKWRIHVFGQDGRHVTSMTLNKEGFKRRLDTRRWRYTTKVEMKAIRSFASGSRPPSPNRPARRGASRDSRTRE